MAQGQTPGDKVVMRIRNKARLMGQDTDALLKRYVLERALYRLAEAYGPKLMLKGSMVAVIHDPEGARPAPDADVHLKQCEDIQTVIPDLLTRTFYDSESPTGLLEDHVTFTRFRFQRLAHSEGAGVKVKIEAMLGDTRVDTAIDFGVGHGAATALEVRKFPAMFAGLPPLFLSCQPAADALADKVAAMYQFGLENTRVKDLYDIAARVRNGTFDVDAVAKALWMRGLDLSEDTACVTHHYAERHEATWRSWLKGTKIRDSRSLAEVVEEIRRPVAAACRKAARLQARETAPALRLVASR